MNKPYIKLIPDKNIKEITLPSLVSSEDDILNMFLTDTAFKTGESFDVIIEEGPQLKFMRASLEALSGNEGKFRVSNIRCAIKREYERIALIFDVEGFDFSAQTVNISSGGMLLRTDKQVEENKIYDLEIDYVSKKLPVKYQVLRVNSDRNSFLVSGKFIDLDKDIKAFIIQQNLKNKIFGLRSSPSKAKSGGENE